MPVETLDSLVGHVQQRVGTAPGALLIRDWLVSSFRDELVPYCNWSWRRRSGAMMFTAPYAPAGGLVTINRGESIATFSGGASIDDTMVGQQLRITTVTKIVTIQRRISSTVVELDQMWTGASISATPFSIYRVYHEVPSDFDGWLTIVDLARGHQLDWWSHSADSLDRMDARRAFGGNVAWIVVMRDYTQQAAGIVGQVVQSRGTGNVPISGGTYTGVADATFTVEMTSATQFKWKRGNGAYTTGVTIDPDGGAQELSSGVSVAFPADVVYTNGDIFTIACRAISTGGMPRYEPWPHVQADEDRPYLYLAKPADLNDPGALIPPYVKPGYLVEKALAACARWKNKDNGYYDLKLAMMHDDRANTILLDMEREDQNRECTDLWYDWQTLPVYDSGFLASHDLGYELNTLD